MEDDNDWLVVPVVLDVILVVGMMIVMMVVEVIVVVTEVKIEVCLVVLMITVVVFARFVSVTLLLWLVLHYYCPDIKNSPHTVSC